MLKFSWMVVALVGHLGIWSAIFNQVHATAWIRFFRKISERVIYVTVIALGIAIGVTIYGPQSGSPWSITMVVYSYLCVGVAVLLGARWALRKIARLRNPPPAKTLSRELIRIGSLFDPRLLHGWQAKLLRWFPGNEVLQLSIEHKSLSIRNLPVPLQDLRVVHVADLHFTGKIDIQYFERVVEQINRLSADFVCLTGDIVDDRKCLDWIPNVLSKVTAKYSRLFILGNHDCRIKDEVLLRKTMMDIGWVDLEGAWKSYPVGAATISFAGNEAPWFNQGLATPSRERHENELLVLLSHAPDQFRWAQQRNIQLMLAGHTHGGQICFPIIGPVIAPSIYGVQYASGAFQQNGTVMHVSRGISGDDPIRLNCPPELTLLRLQDVTLPGE